MRQLERDPGFQTLLRPRRWPTRCKASTAARATAEIAISRVGACSGIPISPGPRARTFMSSAKGTPVQKVDAIVIGAGAGGGIVGQGTGDQRAQRGAAGARPAGTGRTTTARTICGTSARSILGNSSGPEDEGNPRVVVDLQGRERIVAPSQGGYSNNAACVGGGTLTYGAMAWRFHPTRFPDALHLRRARRQHASKTGPSLTTISSPTTKRRNGRSASPATTPAILSRARAASRCRCLPCRRLGSTPS